MLVDVIMIGEKRPPDVVRGRFQCCLLLDDGLELAGPWCLYVSSCADYPG